MVSGVLGVEVSTARLWKRCEELGTRAHRVRQHARPRARRLRGRAALAAVAAVGEPRRDQPADRRGARLPRRRRPAAHGAPTRTPADGSHESDPVPIPDALQEQAEEWRERLMDHVAEASDDLMERYLEGEPIADDELVEAFKDLVVRGELFPVACGAASRNVGTRGAARPDRRRPALAGAGRADPRARPLGRRRRARARGLGRRRLLLQDDRRRARRQAQPAARLRRPDRPGHAARERAHASQGARGADPLVPGHASTSRCPTSARATSAPCPS